MAKRKLYTGNPPKNGRIMDFFEGWELWEFDVVEADKWANGETAWFNVKVMTIEPNPRKANYYIAFNEERYAATRDWKLLQEHADRGVVKWLERFRVAAATERQTNQQANKDATREAEKSA